MHLLVNHLVLFEQLVVASLPPLEILFEQLSLTLQDLDFALDLRVLAAQRVELRFERRTPRLEVLGTRAVALAHSAELRVGFVKQIECGDLTHKLLVLLCGDGLGGAGVCARGRRLELLPGVGQGLFLVGIKALEPRCRLQRTAQFELRALLFPADHPEQLPELRNRLGVAGSGGRGCGCGCRGFAAVARSAVQLRQWRLKQPRLLANRFVLGSDCLELALQQVVLAPHLCDARLEPLGLPRSLGCGGLSLLARVLKLCLPRRRARLERSLVLERLCKFGFSLSQLLGLFNVQKHFPFKANGGILRRSRLALGLRLKPLHVALDIRESLFGGLAPGPSFRDFGAEFLLESRYLVFLSFDLAVGCQAVLLELLDASRQQALLLVEPGNLGLKGRPLLFAAAGVCLEGPIRFGREQLKLFHLLARLCGGLVGYFELRPDRLEVRLKLLPAFDLGVLAATQHLLPQLPLLLGGRLGRADRGLQLARLRCSLFEFVLEAQPHLVRLVKSSLRCRSFGQRAVGLFAKRLEFDGAIAHSLLARLLRLLEPALDAFQLCVHVGLFFERRFQLFVFLAYHALLHRL